MSRLELKTGSSNANQSTKKLMHLLEIMSQNKEPMRLYDLAQQCEMHPTTTLRFLTTLQSMDYVVQHQETNKYSLTHKICRLGAYLQKPGDLRDVAIPYLEPLATAFGACANLIIEDNMSILYLETTSFKTLPHQATRSIGAIADLHCTAAGKLFLIDYSEEQWEQLLAIKGLTPKTKKTITNLDRLQKELMLARINGYAYDDEECEEGISCVATPIRDYTNRIIAALSLSGPSLFMTKPQIQTKLPMLLESAGKISTHMGYDKSSMSEVSMYRR